MKTKEEIKQYKKEWLAKHPNYNKLRYQRLKHIMLPKQREYQRTHVEQARANKRKWIAEHPEEWRAYCRKKMREHYRKTHRRGKRNKW